MPNSKRKPTPEELYNCTRHDCNFLTQNFSRRVSIRVTERLYPYDISPDLITLLSFLMGAAAAALVATGKREWLIVGGLLIQLGFIFDCVDGEVARLKGLSSSFGAWLDCNLNLLVSVCLFFGFFQGARYQVSLMTRVWALLALLTTYLLLNYSAFTTRKIFEAKVEEKFGGWVAKLARILNINPRYISYTEDIKLAIFTLAAFLNRPFWPLIILTVIHLFLLTGLWYGNISRRSSSV